MPRVCTLCNHPQRADIDRELLAGTPYRNIAERFGTSVAAIARHKAHIAERIAVAERETGLATIHDVQRRMAELQERVEKLVTKMEGGNDHRATLAGFRECREGLRAIHDVMVSSDLERRLRALEGDDEGDTESAD